MKVLKKIGIGLGVLIALVLLLGLIVPRDINVERDIVIEASKEKIFPHVQYFAKRDAWYPWNEADPDMKKSSEGTDGEVGAIWRWDGNKEVGAGRQILTGIQPNDRVESDLIFTEPYESEAKTYVQLDEVEGGTKVSWGFDATMPYPFNVMQLFMGADAVGADFTKGLTMLKEIVENTPDSPEYTVKQVDLPLRHFVAVKRTVPMTEITAFYMESLPKVAQAIQKNGVEMTGMPCGLYYAFDEEKGETEMAGGAPVASKTKIEDFESINLTSRKALLIDYYGPYHEIRHAHDAMEVYLQKNGLEPVMPVIEEYVTDPSTEPDSNKWLTRVYYPLNT